jgi:hypothetical protein
MLKMPSTNHPTRELFETQQVVDLMADPMKAVPFPETIRKAQAFLAAESAAKSVNALCLRANGQLWLVRVTTKSWVRKWNFGQLVAA